MTATVVRKFLAGLTGAAAIAAAVSLAPSANAYTGSENNFLQRLDSRGFFWGVWDYPQYWIDAGRWTCTALYSMTGDVAASELVTANPGYTYAQESVFVLDAVETLCPWHDHRDDLIYAS